MAATDTFPLIDRIIPEGLPDWLAKARKRGDSYQTISHRLREEHAVQVGPETVRRWCQRAGLTATDPAS